MSIHITEKVIILNIEGIIISIDSSTLFKSNNVVLYSIK